MAVRILQFGTVFAIGFYLGLTSVLAGASGTTVFTSHASTTGLSTSNTSLPEHLQLEGPRDVTVAKGQSTTLSCDYDNLPDVTQIEWYHNGNLILTNETRKFQQLKNGSLFIGKVLNNAGRNGVVGEYHCLARTRQGAALMTSLVRLRAASLERDFSHNPQNVEVLPGQPTFLTCQIHSIPQPKIQWIRGRNGLEVLPDDNHHITDKGLLILSVQKQHLGSYKCIAKNTLLNKTRTSQEGVISFTNKTVEAAPPEVLKVVPENTTAFWGDNITLVCAVIGWPKPVVTWLNDEGVVIANTTVFSINNVSTNNTGTYRCSAHNSAGRTTQKYHVSVYQKLYFNITPTSRIYPTALRTRLDCQPIGVPEPRVFWLKNGQPLKFDGRIKKVPFGLVFSHTFTYDSGIYQCVAVNSAGRISAAAQLVITSSKKLDPPDHVQCRPFDETSVCLTWRVPSNVNVTAFTVYSFFNDSDGEKAGNDYLTNNTFQLADGLSIDTNYTFYIRLYEKVASDGSTRVTCRTGFKDERQITLEAISPSEAFLKWTQMPWDTPCNSLQKQEYLIEWVNLEKSDNLSSTTVQSLNYTIKGLVPGAEYLVKFKAKWYDLEKHFMLNLKMPGKLLSEGTSLVSDDKTQITVLVPQNLKVESTGPTTVNLTWSWVKAKTDGFIICYFAVKLNDLTAGKDCKKIRTSSNFAEISKLKPRTLYEFKVKSLLGSDVSSLYSKGVRIETPDDVPARVIGLEYKILNESSVCLSWQYPSSSSQAKLKFLVSFSPDKNRPLEKWDKFFVTSNTPQCTFNVQQKSAFLTGLQVQETYNVLVLAVSNEIIGHPPRPIEVSTKEILLNNKNFNEDNSNDFLHNNNQKIGVVIGIALAGIFVVISILCVVLRRRCVKRRVLNEARKSNYSPGTSAHYASHGGNVQVRLEDRRMLGEVQETEHLVGDSIPPLSTNHLDTKGSDSFPNGHLNGVKPFLNGTGGNGHVHITENPQFYAFDCNGRTQPQEEDSNSNVKSSKFYDLHRIFENSKKNLKPQTKKYHQCNGAETLNKIKLSNGDLNRSSSIESLNNTVQTNLDDSGVSVITSHNRRLSPVIAPNG